MLPAVAAFWSAEINRTLTHAWAPSTLNHYENGLAHFHTFCDNQGVHADARLPASEFLLCSFAASHAGTHAISTVDGKLAAIRAWHILNNVPYAGSLRLNYVLKGIENLSPACAAPRPPITLNMLGLLHDNLNLSSPLDAAVYATATCSFWGQCRLGEILSKWERSFDPSLTPAIKHLGPPCTVPGSRILHLPWTKTKGAKGDDVFISRQRGHSDAIEALINHMKINNLHADDPLFSFRTSQGGLLALTKKKFLKRCNEIWGRLSLPHITGHSFRIGGTTELLIAGVPPDVVKMMGRWSSDAFLRYWRSLHRVAPLHAELLPPNSPVRST